MRGLHCSVSACLRLGVSGAVPRQWSQEEPGEEWEAESEKEKKPKPSLWVSRLLLWATGAHSPWAFLRPSADAVLVASHLRATMWKLPINSHLLACPDFWLSTCVATGSRKPWASREWWCREDVGRALTVSITCTQRNKHGALWKPQREAGSEQDQNSDGWQPHCAVFCRTEEWEREQRAESLCLIFFLKKAWGLFWVHPKPTPGMCLFVD